MVSVPSEARLQQLLARPDNSLCFDCSEGRTQWAVVSFGIFVCEKCAEEHRKLGIKVSFVRGVEEPGWNEKSLAAMSEGGNQALEEFFALYSISRNAPVSFKYRTKAAEFYSHKLKKLSAGLEDLSPRPDLLLGDTVLEDELLQDPPDPVPGAASTNGEAALAVLSSVATAIETRAEAMYEQANELTKRPMVKRAEETMMGYLFALDMKVSGWLRRKRPETR